MHKMWDDCMQSTTFYLMNLSKLLCVWIVHEIGWGHGSGHGSGHLLTKRRYLLISMWKNWHVLTLQMPLVWLRRTFAMWHVPSRDIFSTFCRWKLMGLRLFFSPSCTWMIQTESFRQFYVANEWKSEKKKKKNLCFIIYRCRLFELCSRLLFI